VEPARLLVVDVPGSKHATIGLADFGAAHESPDSEALRVLNDVLSNLATSRMNKDLRATHAYTYGVNSVIEMRQAPGPMLIGSEVSGADTGAAIARMLDVLARVVADGVTEEELDVAKRHRVALAQSEYETTVTASDALSDLFVYARPADYHVAHVERIRALTTADVKRVATKYIRPDKLKVIVVGDWRVIGPATGGLGLGAPAMRDPFGDPVAAGPPH
jgi:predicted Zn-dependent peptidase